MLKLFFRGSLPQDAYRKVPFDREKIAHIRQVHREKGSLLITDNFLRSWLAAVSNQVTAINFKPVEQLVKLTDDRMREVEGAAFEKMVAQLYSERSRKGVGDFPLSERIDGYWDRADMEIDLVALNEERRTIRFGSCKRSADRLIQDVPVHDAHIDRFMNEHRHYEAWKVEKVALAPHIPVTIRNELTRRGRIAQDINDLLEGLRPAVQP